MLPQLIIRLIIGIPILLIGTLFIVTIFRNGLINSDVATILKLICLAVAVSLSGTFSGSKTRK